MAEWLMWKDMACPNFHSPPPPFRLQYLSGDNEKIQNISVRIAALRTEAETQDFANKKQECQPVNR